MVTLKDVAKRAGVSIATVSRVMSNSDAVADKSRQRVLEAIEELGYYSNELARGLRQEKINAVAVILPDISNPFFADMLRGIDDVLSTCSYFILFNNTDNNIQVEKKCLENMRSMALSGALVYCCHRSLEELAPSLPANSDTVFLSGGNGLQADNTHFLSFSRKDTAYAAAKHLYGLNRQKLLLMLSSFRQDDNEFTEGIKKAAEETGGSYSIATSADNERDASRVFGQAYAAEHPDGVITESDIQAMGILSWLRTSGIDVPGDISMAGLGNTSLAQCTEPALTSAGPSGYQIGMAGANQLLNLIQKDSKNFLRDTKTLEQMLLPNIIVRGTSK